MPTGYTACVGDGEITEFAPFALRCARAFGVAITMRDDPMDVPIPETFKPDTRYHDERIATTTALLAELGKLTGRECEHRAQVERTAALTSEEGYRQKRADTRARYEAMLAKVDAWDAPAEWSELKVFMLKQLRESINFDCRDYSTDHPRLTGEEWKAKTITKANRDLAYHTEERTKEIERAAERTRMMQSLRASFQGMDPGSTR